LKHPAERALAFELLQFGDVVHAVLKYLMPNKICEYLRDLAAKFTEFVTQCKVLDSPEQNSRLLLCDATGVVMRQLFHFLGISPLYKI
jgi:arginyl-tRNA synthetase